MSGFRKSITVLREAVGSYVNGVFVPGARSAGLVLASVQPVKMGTDMQALPEGRHMSDFKKVYTSDRLQVSADGEGLQPDIIVHGGYAYEIVDMDENQSDVINHYRYLACKVFKYTDQSVITDWLGSAGLSVGSTTDGLEIVGNELRVAFDDLPSA